MTPSPAEPLTHVCPCCDGAIEGQDPHCWCDGLGAITAAKATAWTSDGQPMPRELPPIPKRLTRPCDSCAFRKGSPEREDFGTQVKLAEQVGEGIPFFCHVGMPVDARGKHVPTRGLVDGRPVGHPVCNGWTRSRKRYLAHGVIRALRPVGSKPFAEERAR